MKKIIKYIKKNKVKSIIGLGIILSLLVVFISFSLADPTPNYTFTYNSTGTNNDYSNNDGGSFRLNKSIQWVSHNKLKVTMFIDSKEFINSTGNDVLLVVDTSSFLDNNMLNDLKSSLISASSFINSKDSTTRIGIISFSNSYTKYNFTNDLSTIESNISNLTIGGGRSYYQAFSGMDDILINRDISRGLKVIFITTGLSSINRSGDIYKYEQIDNKYHLNMNCIYYLTNSLLTQPSNYFNKELIASKDTLETNIESLALASDVYTNFTITDHYDTTKYSLVGSLSDYNGSSQYTNYGDLEVTSVGTINWIMGSNDDRPFFTGTTAKLEYELNYTGGTGNYTLNSSNISVSKTLNQTTSNFNITDSLVTGNSYNVTYASNAPSGCTPSGIPASSHKDVYEAVQFPSNPTCNGYKFAGWKVTTSGVNTSDNGFVMPANNVEVKATWSKISVTKSMDGDVEEAPTAYKILKNEAKKENGLAKEYDTFFAGQGYSHQDAYDGSGAEKIYFFRNTNSGDASKIKNANNVIFADHCWQMLRTTDTGGIKMIYNGEPEIGETGHEECQTTRGGHVGYNADSSDILAIAAGTVYYGSDYKYENNVFSLDTSKTITTSSDWENDYPNLIGKYTCNSTSQNGTCQTLYLIESFNSPTRANALKLKFITTATGVYSQFGEVPFNRQSTSPADVGYMYNTRYKYLSHTDLDTTSYWFGSGYSYDYNATTGQYEYTLTGTGDNPKGSTDDISETHYTCWKANKTDTCTTISYVYYHSSSGTSAKNMYYINLSDNRSVNSYLDEMLNNDNVNQYNSTIKLAIDKWYEHYILPYPEFTSKLENAVFCNDRSIKSLGGWDPGGSQTSYLQFKNYTLDNNLNCSNLTDRFSADNNNTKAHLTYPVGLMSASEMNLLNNNELRKTGTYRLISPIYFHHLNAIGCSVRSTGAVSYINVNLNYGVRPSVSLKAGVKFTSGNGSMSEPYRVD